MFERRLQILLAVLAVVCCGLIVRAVSLQAVGRDHWTDVADKALSDVRTVATTRGRILDVKGRELAVDKPCIDACVHYQAVAFFHSARSLRQTAFDRLLNKDKSILTQTPAEQRRRVDAEVAKVIVEGSDISTLKWLRSQARTRIRRQNDNYDQLPLAERWRLLNAEVCAVAADLETMWLDLAKASRTSPQQKEADLINAMDEQRRQIVRRIENRRRSLWYAKYNSATKTVTKKPWYAALLGGGGETDIDQFDLHVSEERDVHVILPHINYELRNELARNADRYPGLVLREGVVRTYPYGSVACQTIGRTAKVTAEDVKADPNAKDPLLRYSDTDDIGREGLERLFESTLRGKRGSVSGDDEDADVMLAADGTPAPAADTGSSVAPVPGRDITTTIDADLQAAVEQAFKKVDFVRSVHLETDEIEMPGAAVLIDVATGEIRAMASWPTYDLNKFDELYPTLVKDQINRPLANRALGPAREPGSTVKPMVGIAAISAGLFGPHDTIHCDGYVVIGGHRYTSFGRCWTVRMNNGGTHQTLANPHPTGDLTFVDALQRSCNVFHEELAFKLGIGGLSQWFDKFGLGKPVGIGLPESDGVLPDSWHGPQQERLSTTLFAGIGQGSVQATPIQMANVAATIARDGVAIKPTLQRGERNPRVDLHLNREAVAEAKAGMYAVVNEPGGTGRQAEMEDVIVAAKTGSAQTGPLRIPIRDDENKPLRTPEGRVMYHDVVMGTHANPTPEAPWYRGTGPDEKTRPAHGWMIGFAPADKPKVAFAVLVEYGGGGGSAAGAVVRHMLDACVEQGYLNATVPSTVK